LRPPSWISGSHKLGVLAVKEFDYSSTGASGGLSFRITGGKEYAESEYVHEEVLFGEGLVFSTLLLHKSEPNNSQVARVNVQVRFDDALARESFERNYPEGLYLGDSLSKTYPEHISHDQ
jgi:ectoine hydroxylase-related dioxygenase (phytanoyl-CoA dioxygenase family)